MSTITLPVETIEQVEKQLAATLAQVRKIKKQTKTAKPPKFWTKKQWDNAEKEADEDIKAGRVYKLDNVKDLDKSAQELFNESSDNSTI